ncbi:MAG: beta-N-acetylhexosaminidase [Xanthomonadales bacterium]|nr:beta-N-acetylhexosaminidase [Xanthomonadales bacterium]
MLMTGIAGTELCKDEAQWLRHDAVAGVILFARNFSSRAQVTQLIAAIREASPRPLLVAVDQEGGPVQRFRKGFTRLPELGRLGVAWEGDRELAKALAHEHAWLMASEMRAVGIDLSFAPVVDVARGNRAIGVRAFHESADACAELGITYIEGMHEAGMAATLKHYPGHGSVLEDTHVDFADDDRPLEAIRELDLKPFVAGIAAGAEAVMMAHVRYPQVDAQPAGYSPRWIIELLRDELGFDGIVISDDIGMAAATGMGDVAARVQGHLDAGCDLVLACAPDLVPDALAACANRPAGDRDPVAMLQGRGEHDWRRLIANPRWQAAVERLADGPQLAD